MLIPLRHENVEGRRWPLISIARVVINLVVFLATHGQIKERRSSRPHSASRRHASRT